MKGRTGLLIYCCLFFVFFVCFVVVRFSSSAIAGADADSAADEQALHAARLPVDGPSLLTLFRRRTPDAASQTHIKALIVQLGSDSFSEREEASEEVAECGVQAVGLLREATHHKDLEIRRRAREALAVVEQNDLTEDVLISALRVLGRRQPPRMIEVLMAYAPHAAGPDITEELSRTLSAVAQRDGEADPALVRALRAKSPVQRGVAAAALCRAGCRQQFPTIRRLLRDPNPQVRRRVALALVEAREKAAVPVLIDLLAELPVAEAEPIESILMQLAGDSSPVGQAFQPDSSERQAGKPDLREAWAAWWKRHGDDLDLTEVALSPRWRGYTLAVCLWVGRRAKGRTGCIVEFDARGRTRWQMQGLSWPVDAQVLDERRVLVTEHNPGQVTERSHNGDILRRIKVSGSPLEARRLPNGHTFVVTRTRVLEVDRAGKEVWKVSPRVGTIVAACPLRGGQLAVCCRTGELIRLDRTGKILAETDIARRFRTSGMHLHALPNGHVLVPLFYEGKVVEFDKNGREVWSASYPLPMSAQRLPNGRTLVAGYRNNLIVELDKNGREVKSQRCDGPLMSARGR